MKNLLEELKSSFPELYDIHDFHVWQLTPARIIASAHIVLEQTHGYLAIQHNIVDFLQSKGISHITLQPEFLQVSIRRALRINFIIIHQSKSKFLNSYQ